MVEASHPTAPLPHMVAEGVEQGGENTYKYVKPKIHLNTMNHFLRCYATRLLTTLTAILLSTAARSQETLTVYEYIPSDYENNYSAYIPVDFLDFDEYSRSQFVIPAADLAIMEGGTITGISFYEASMKTYTTDCSVDVYLKEVSSTTINAFV